VHPGEPGVRPEASRAARTTVGPLTVLAPGRTADAPGPASACHTGRPSGRRPRPTAAPPRCRPRDAVPSRSRPASAQAAVAAAVAAAGTGGGWPAGGLRREHRPEHRRRVPVDPSGWCGDGRPGTATPSLLAPVRRPRPGSPGRAGGSDPCRQADSVTVVYGPNRSTVSRPAGYRAGVTASAATAATRSSIAREPPAKSVSRSDTAGIRSHASFRRSAIDARPVVTAATNRSIRRERATVTAWAAASTVPSQPESWSRFPSDRPLPSDRLPRGIRSL
jgi:hypothetical protein